MSAETLVFKSEEDRVKAIEAIPMTPPKGKTQDEWNEETSAQMDAIFAAPIDENAVPAEPGAAPAAPAPATPVEDIHSARQKALEEELARERAENAKKLKELEDQLKAATAPAAPTAPVAPAVAPDVMAKIEAEINELTTALEGVDDVFDDADHVKKLQKLTILNSKYNALVKKNYEAEAKSRSEAEATRQKELQAASEKSKRDREEEERLKRQINGIEEFRKGRKEYETGKTFDKMSEEWAAFASEVATAWFGKRPSVAEQEKLEVAMSKYLAGVPSLMEELKKRGLKEPTGMRQYMELTEIDLLAQGYVQDQATGEWKELKNAYGQRVSFPSHVEAAEYYKRIRGIADREKVESGRASSQSARDAAGRRVHPIELDESARGGGGADIEMTEAEMESALAAFDNREMSILYHKNPQHPRILEYNKLCKKLGLPDLEEVLGDER